MMRPIVTSLKKCAPIMMRETATMIVKAAPTKNKVVSFPLNFEEISGKPANMKAQAALPT